VEEMRGGGGGGGHGTWYARSPWSSQSMGMKIHFKQTEMLKKSADVASGIGSWLFVRKDD